MDYNVYVKPSLSIVASTNTMVLNLNPSSKPFDTANLNVTVGTNNLYGYKLFMTTDNDTTYLDRDTSSDGVSANIPTLAVSSATQSSSDLINHWGYRVNNDVGGDSNIIDTTGTNFFPYTPTPTQPLISSATTASNERTASLTFGTKIDFNQPSGTYDLLLKFKAIPNVTTYYMQDIAADPTLAASVCTEEPTTVVDKRDEQSYTIRRIGGDCWMIENLKFVGTELTPADSNVAANTTLNYDDFDVRVSFDDPIIHGANITTSMSPIDSSVAGTTRTVWYNYSAATAGTITGNSNTGAQVYDICPAGWRLPNTVETNNILSSVSEFNPVAGGFYSAASTISRTDAGFWWMSDAGRYEYTRYFLGYVNGALSTGDTGNRSTGVYVRCIMRDTSTTLADISTMQEMTSDIVRNTPDDAPEKTLRDTRDNQDYTVRKIAGAVWMTRNLAIGCNGSGTTYGSGRTARSLTSTDSNVSDTWSTSSAYSLDKTDGTSGCTTSSTSGCDSVSTTRMKCDATYGAWYNYAAATANTITASTGINESIYDVCPTGWKLPSRSEITTLLPYSDQFRVLLGGEYIHGVIQNATRYGQWWTSTPDTDTSSQRYFLYYNYTPSFSTMTGTRAYGFYVRCIAK